MSKRKVFGFVLRIPAIFPALGFLTFVSATVPVSGELQAEPITLSVNPREQVERAHVSRPPTGLGMEMDRTGHIRSALAAPIPIAPTLPNATQAYLLRPDRPLMPPMPSRALRNRDWLSAGAPRRQGSAAKGDWVKF